MRLVLGTALLAATVLAAAACGSSHSTGRPPANAETQGGPNSSSRLILGGAVRCTATVQTPVEVGRALGITFTFQNVSDHAVSLPIPYGGMWVIVQSADGTKYDTRVPLENEDLVPSGPLSVPAGRTKTERLLRDLPVRWEGPLRISPGCGLAAAPALHVTVASPGLPPSPTAAVADVVAATRHLLDHCRPRTSGVSVVGRIDPPSGKVPPLQARCSVTLHREGDFYRAQVLVVTPPNLRGAAVSDPYEQLTPLWEPGDHRNAQVVGWEFVVTRDGAISVNSADTAETVPHGWAPDWVWGNLNPGGSRCGFDGGGSGGVNGPDVSFISACGR